MSLYDVAADRNRRLERADRHISRCPECGAWRWQYACTVDHDARSTRGGEVAA
jgi:hypothetical protein